MPERRHPQVINIDEIEPEEQVEGRFGYKERQLGDPCGAKALGFNWMELQPGQTAYPYHYHTAIEEGLYILEGSGELRIGQDRVAVRQGDYIAFPTGPDHAHCLTNTGGHPLRYLSFSDRTGTDIVGYPDSKKFSFKALDGTNGYWVSKRIHDQPSVGYFEGEDTGEKPGK
jgi:uncharacterized cupin superfamily protein